MIKLKKILITFTTLAAFAMGSSQAATPGNTFVMAKDIARKIEDEMTYPGQIRVNVIRETRATDYAK